MKAKEITKPVFSLNLIGPSDDNNEFTIGSVDENGVCCPAVQLGTVTVDVENNKLHVDGDIYAGGTDALVSPEYITLSHVFKNDKIIAVFNITKSDESTCVVIGSDNLPGATAIEWGDGCIDYASNNGVWSHCYEKIGTYVCFIYGVTGIGNYAFHDDTRLISVNIPGSVISIGDEAFERCTNLSSVTINYGVESMGIGAFVYCTSLTHIVLPDSVMSIGESLFAECGNLKDVTIPNSVSHISRGAFMNCKDLVSITIPNSITEISQYAFNGCSNLTTVYYRGSMADWSNMTIGSDNAYLVAADKYYLYKGGASLLKYISSADDPEVITELKEENAVVVDEYLDYGLFTKSMALWDETAGYYYPLKEVYFNNSQYNFVFDKGNGYTASYNPSTGAYDFNEL